MCARVSVFLSRFHEARALCKSAGTKTDWAEVGKACLVHMEVELAIQAFRMSSNVAMVLSLQGIQVQAPHHPRRMCPTPPITIASASLVFFCPGYRGHEPTGRAPGHVSRGPQPGPGPLPVFRLPNRCPGGETHKCRLMLLFAFNNTVIDYMEKALILYYIYIYIYIIRCLKRNYYRLIKKSE